MSKNKISAITASAWSNKSYNESYITPIKSEFQKSWLSAIMEIIPFLDLFAYSKAKVLSLGVNMVVGHFYSCMSKKYMIISYQLKVNILISINNSIMKKMDKKIPHTFSRGPYLFIKFNRQTINSLECWLLLLINNKIRCLCQCWKSSPHVNTCTKHVPGPWAMSHNWGFLRRKMTKQRVWNQVRTYILSGSCKPTAQTFLNIVTNTL